MILLSLFIIFVIGFVVALFNTKYDWSEWVLMFCLAGIFSCLIIGVLQGGAKYVEITTKQPPQIDTTITYSNGVADTVYTYHIIKKE